MPRLALVLAAAAATLLFLLPFVTQHTETLMTSGALIDDAYFYAVISERIASGGAPSLDGIHITNGFQPLWMGLLIVLRLTLPSADMIAILHFTGAACLVAAAALLTSWMARDTKPATLVVIAASLGLSLLYEPFVARTLLGLETPLLLFGLAVWLLAARAALHPGAGLASAVVLAVAASALFLTRTDLFWAPILSTVVIAHRHRLTAPSLANIALSAVLILPYLLWNKLRFGALVPISGRVKAFYLEHQFPTLPDYLASNEWRGLISLLDHLWGWATVPAVLLMAAALLYRRTRRALPAELKLLALICALHVAYLQLAHGELRPYTNYYFVPEALTLLLILTQSARQLIETHAPVWSKSRSWHMPLVVTLLIGYAWLTALPQRPQNEHWTNRVALARDIKSIVPPGGKVGAFWPGVFAYLAERPVVPLDGIASSPDYLRDVIKPGREIDYALETGIDYIAVMLPEDVDLAQPMAKAPDWPHLYYKRLSDAQHVRFMPMARFAYNNGHNAWILFRLFAKTG